MDLFEPLVHRIEELQSCPMPFEVHTVMLQFNQGDGYRQGLRTSEKNSGLVVLFVSIMSGTSVQKSLFLRNNILVNHTRATTAEERSTSYDGKVGQTLDENFSKISIPEVTVITLVSLNEQRLLTVFLCWALSRT